MLSRALLILERACFLLCAASAFAYTLL